MQSDRAEHSGAPAAACRRVGRRSRRHMIQQPSAGCEIPKIQDELSRLAHDPQGRKMSLKPQKHEQRRPCPRQAGRVRRRRRIEVVPVQIKIESAVVQQAQARLRQQSGAMRAVAVNVSSVLNGLDMQIATQIRQSLEALSRRCTTGRPSWRQ